MKVQKKIESVGMSTPTVLGHISPCLLGPSSEQETCKFNSYRNVILKWWGLRAGRHLVPSSHQGPYLGLKPRLVIKSSNLS